MMLLLRPLLLAAALIAAIPAPALAGANDAVPTPDWKSDAAAIAAPVLRASAATAGDGSAPNSSMPLLTSWRMVKPACPL